jgi:TBC1 domain family member 8/9
VDLSSASTTFCLETNVTKANSLMREYFASLGNSAHPDSTDPRARAITRFQELLLVSFREFAIITDDTILAERRKYRGEVVQSIESFSRRAAVRNLKTLERFTKDQAGLIYDALYRSICIAPPPLTPPLPPALFTTKNSAEERPEARIGLRTFRVFMSEIATWARDEKIVMNGFQVIHYSLVLFWPRSSTVSLQRRIDRDVADHEFIDRLFVLWDTSYRGSLSFQVRSDSWIDADA